MQNLSSTQDLIATITNAVYLIIFVSGLFFVLRLIFSNQSKKNKKKEVDFYKMAKKREKRNLDSGPISTYLNQLDEYYFNKNPEKASSSVNLVLVFSVFLTGLAIYFLGLAVGIFAFLGFHLLIKMALQNPGEDKMKGFEYRLPEVIDILMRCFSKSDDVQSILYETSLEIDEPFHSLFGNIARKMTSSGHLSVLNEYAHQSNNVWVHSLFTVLIRYKEDAKKEDTIKNLRHLRDMISQENQLKRALMSDKRYSVVLNYLIAGVSILGNIVLFLFFPEIAQPSYFGTPIGPLALLGGYLCVIGVHTLTKKMSNNKGGL